jgi:hypothetical protein
MIVGLLRVEALNFDFIAPLRAVLGTGFTGKRFTRKLGFRLQQTQLAGTRHGFGASLDLKFVKDIPIVPFNST